MVFTDSGSGTDCSLPTPPRRARPARRPNLSSLWSALPAAVAPATLQHTLVQETDAEWSTEWSGMGVVDGEGGGASGGGGGVEKVGVSQTSGPDEGAEGNLGRFHIIQEGAGVLPGRKSTVDLDQPRARTAPRHSPANSASVPPQPPPRQPLFHPAEDSDDSLDDLVMNLAKGKTRPPVINDYSSDSGSDRDRHPQIFNLTSSLPTPSPSPSPALSQVTFSKSLDLEAAGPRNRSRRDGHAYGQGRKRARPARRGLTPLDNQGKGNEDNEVVVASEGGGGDDDEAEEVKAEEPLGLRRSKRQKQSRFKLTKEWQSRAPTAESSDDKDDSETFRPVPWYLGAENDALADEWEPEQANRGNMLRAPYAARQSKLNPLEMYTDEAAPPTTSRVAVSSTPLPPSQRWRKSKGQRTEAEAGRQVALQDPTKKARGPFLGVVENTSFYATARSEEMDPESVPEEAGEWGDAAEIGNERVELKRLRSLIPAVELVLRHAGEEGAQPRRRRAVRGAARETRPVPDNRPEEVATNNKPVLDLGPEEEVIPNPPTAEVISQPSPVFKIPPGARKLLPQPQVKAIYRDIPLQARTKLIKPRPRCRLRLGLAAVDQDFARANTKNLNLFPPEQQPHEDPVIREATSDPIVQKIQHAGASHGPRPRLVRLERTPSMTDSIAAMPTHTETTFRFGRAKARRTGRAAIELGSEPMDIDREVETGRSRVSTGLAGQHAPRTDDLVTDDETGGEPDATEEYEQPMTEDAPGAEPARLYKTLSVTFKPADSADNPPQSSVPKHNTAVPTASAFKGGRASRARPASWPVSLQRAHTVGAVAFRGVVNWPRLQVDRRAGKMEPLRTTPSFDLSVVVPELHEPIRARDEEQGFEGDKEDDVHQSSHEYDPSRGVGRLKTALMLPGGGGKDGTVPRQATRWRLNEAGTGGCADGDAKLEMPPPAQLQRKISVGEEDPMEVDGDQAEPERAPVRLKLTLGAKRVVAHTSNPAENDDKDGIEESPLIEWDEYDKELERDLGGEDMIAFDEELVQDADECSCDRIQTDQDFELGLLEADVEEEQCTSQTNDMAGADAPNTEEYFGGPEDVGIDRALALTELEMDRGEGGGGGRGWLSPAWSARVTLKTRKTTTSVEGSGSTENKGQAGKKAGPSPSAPVSVAVPPPRRRQPAVVPVARAQPPGVQRAPVPVVHSRHFKAIRQTPAPEPAREAAPARLAARPGSPLPIPRAIRVPSDPEAILELPSSGSPPPLRQTFGALDNDLSAPRAGGGPALSWWEAEVGGRKRGLWEKRGVATRVFRGVAMEDSGI